MMRTDDNNNPTALTVDVARQADLIYKLDYAPGTQFPNQPNLVTAKLLGDPIALTIEVIDRLGYYTRSGHPRWEYIAIPRFIWTTLTREQKRDIIGFHYQNEGGTSMRDLFPNYGQR